MAQSLTLLTCSAALTVAFSAADVSPAHSSRSVGILALEDLVPIPRVSIWLAQVGNGGVSGGSDPDPGVDENNATSTTTNSRNVTATPATTQAIAQDIEVGGNFCDQLQNEYLIDCLAQSLRKTASALPRSGDYADSREILLDSARRLDRIVRNNRDRAKPAISVTTQQRLGTVKFDRVLPLKQERLQSARALATQVLEEAETKLLRSSGSSEKSVAYRRIAAAVGSNKILLRAS